MTECDWLFVASVAASIVVVFLGFAAHGARIAEDEAIEREIIAALIAARRKENAR